MSRALTLARCLTLGVCRTLRGYALDVEILAPAFKGGWTPQALEIVHFWHEGTLPVFYAWAAFVWASFGEHGSCRSLYLEPNNFHECHQISSFLISTRMTTRIHRLLRDPDIKGCFAGAGGLFEQKCYVWITPPKNDHIPDDALKCCPITEKKSQ